MESVNKALFTDNVWLENESIPFFFSFFPFLSELFVCLSVCLFAMRFSSARRAFPLFHQQERPRPPWIYMYIYIFNSLFAKTTRYAYMCVCVYILYVYLYIDIYIARLYIFVFTLNQKIGRQRLIESDLRRAIPYSPTRERERERVTPRDATSYQQTNGKINKTRETRRSAVASSRRKDPRRRRRKRAKKEADGAVSRCSKERAQRTQKKKKKKPEEEDEEEGTFAGDAE